MTPTVLITDSAHSSLNSSARQSFEDALDTPASSDVTIPPSPSPSGVARSRPASRNAIQMQKAVAEARRIRDGAPGSAVAMATTGSSGFGVRRQLSKNYVSPAAVGGGLSHGPSHGRGGADPTTPDAALWGADDHVLDPTRGYVDGPAEAAPPPLPPPRRGSAGTGSGLSPRSARRKSPRGSGCSITSVGSEHSVTSGELGRISNSPALPAMLGFGVASPAAAQHANATLLGFGFRSPSSLQSDQVQPMPRPHRVTTAGETRASAPPPVPPRPPTPSGSSQQLAGRRGSLTSEV